MKNDIERLKKNIRDILSIFEGWSWIKALLILSALYLTAIYPLMRADFVYRDDQVRVHTGMAAWGAFSRYVTNALSHFVHAGMYLADISPLTQILAVLILAATGIILLYQMKDKKEFSLWDILAIVPAGISPFFMQCLSYKYDSPYMALSVLVSVFPILFCRMNKIIYCGIVFICTLTMCMTYQVSSGIFPMAVLMLGFIMWLRKEELKDILIFIAASAGAYTAGIIVFFTVFMRKVDTYVSNGIAPFSTIIANYKKYFQSMYNDMKPGWLYCFLLLTVCFVIVSVMKSRQKKVLTLIVSLAAAAGMILLSFGLYPFLVLPSFSPRSMYGIGTCMALICIGCLSEMKGKWIIRLLTAALAWYFIVFSCVYGNALAVQKEYDNFRIEEVIDDLTDLEEFCTEEEKFIQIKGHISHADPVKNMLKEYPILKKMIRPQFAEGWRWGKYKFYNFYSLGENVSDIQDIDEYDDWTLLQESTYHKIFGKDNYFVVELK